MEFFNVKKGKKVVVADSKCEKVVYPRQTSKGVQKRYAVKAVDDDGISLTKFIKEDAFKALKCPEGKPAAKAKKK